MEENKNVDFEKLEPHDRLKYEIAEELGLLRSEERRVGKECM